MNPLVSIVIPSYNRSQMLRECVDSFIRQRCTNFEMIIVDDGSEESLEWVTNLDKRIRYFRQERNGYGADRARNLGNSKAKGKYILQFDSDDLATNRLLQEEVNLLESRPEYDAVYTDIIVRNINGAKERCIFDDCHNNQEKNYKKMLHHQFIPHGGVMWRKEKLPAHDESLPAAGDWELYLTAFENGVKFYHLNKALWIQRIGHEREAYGQRQIEGCHIVLDRRGYRFDEINRIGIKL